MEMVTIKSGEQLEIIRVVGPDAEWKEPIIKTLQHKGESWVDIIQMTLEQSLEGVQCCYYLGLLDGEIAGNITITEATEQGVGSLGHVFTSISHRRKGICMALMGTVTRDFTARDGRVMTLGTGYDSPAYHIYSSFGFAGIGTSGRMIWEARVGFLDDYFAAAASDVADISWPDWLRLDLLYTIPEGSFLRGIYFTHYGACDYENHFLRLSKLITDTESAQSKVLIKPGGEVVGHALLLPDPYWHNDVWLLDLFVHPDFYPAAGELLAAIELPPGHKVQAYADSHSPEKIQLLEGAGFHQEAVLRNQIVNAEGQHLDVHMFAATQ